MTGTMHNGDTDAAQAQKDAHSGYDTLKSEMSTDDMTGADLGGLTLPAGVYTFSSSVGLTGTLTLDAHDNPAARFVFQVGCGASTLCVCEYMCVFVCERERVFMPKGLWSTRRAVRPRHNEGSVWESCQAACGLPGRS